MMTNKRSAEKTVRDIRRASRRHYSAEEKPVLYWKVFAERIVLPAVKKGPVTIEFNSRMSPAHCCEGREVRY